MQKNQSISDAAIHLSVDEEEVARFGAQSAQWWDERGAFALLHQITPLRIGYLVDQWCSHAGTDRTAQQPLAGVRIADIGCGGGLASEPLARLGAQVIGVDASERNIEAAHAHAVASGLAIDYRATTAEALAASGERYDLVLALEIIEHVADVAAFLEALAALVRPGGLLCISTMNRTLTSLALAKVAAEYVLRWVPRGTHDWQRFLRPSEIAMPLEEKGFSVCDVTGMVYHPLRREWRLDAHDHRVNYLICLKRGVQKQQT